MCEWKIWSKDNCCGQTNNLLEKNHKKICTFHSFFLVTNKMTAKTTPAYFIRRVLYQCYKVIIDPIMLMWVANVTHPCPKATMASIFKQTSMPIHTIFYYTTEFRVMTVIIKNLSLINSLSLHNIKTNNALIPKAN